MNKERSTFCKEQKKNLIWKLGYTLSAGNAARQDEWLVKIHLLDIKTQFQIVGRVNWTGNANNGSAEVAGGFVPQGNVGECRLYDPTVACKAYLFTQCMIYAVFFFVCTNCTLG